VSVVEAAPQAAAPAAVPVVRTDDVTPQPAAHVATPPAPVPQESALVAPLPTPMRAVAAPLPLDQLLPMLESAGMTLAQTNAEKHAVVQARIAAEPPAVHIPRERVELPPLDMGPLVQVETRHNAPPPLA